MEEAPGVMQVVSRENWIAELLPLVRDAVERRMTTSLVPAGAKIARAGEPCTRIFQIVQGYVRLNGLHEDGSETLITIYAPGNSYAETAMVARRPYNHTSIAMVDTTIRTLAADDFWDVYREHPAIADSLCRKFASAITRQIASREARATLKLGERIALMFENFAIYCAEDEGSGRRIAFPITQSDIATLFDVTRQSVYREISRLRTLGLVEKRAGVWIVRDVNRLRQLALVR